VPLTIVHGDFIHKNIRLREGEYGTELLAFDWEKAGYGTPAADLAWVDPLTYYLVVSSAWPQIDFETVQRLVRAAKIFRLLASIHWEAHWLAYQWVENPMANMRLYSYQLKNATRGLSVDPVAG
jgi:aminoglycoside phosphotransferase (APT) family kinase protein